jgi:tRNA (mo5U34)-methyltransferase
MEKITTAATNGRLNEQIQNLRPWFHNLHLPNGIQTAPTHNFGDFPKVKWDQIKNKIPKDLNGWTALDIGCNAGFYSFELAKRGADVLGIDLDPHYLRQARWASKVLKLNDRVTFKQMQVYDLAKLRRTFDIVIFMGVFYHLRYPMLALDIVTQKVKNILVFQTLTMPGDEVQEVQENTPIMKRNKMVKKGWPVMAFIEKKLADDPTNWWAPNHSCILSMLRTCGFKTVSKPGHEIYIAKPDEQLKPVSTTWNHSEYLSAIGQEWMNKVEVKVKGKNSY